MKSRLRVRLVDLAVIALIGYYMAPLFTQRAPKKMPNAFQLQVDLDPLRHIAVHDVGRIKSFDSFARATTRNIGGPRGFADTPPVYAYLDMMFRPQEYVHADVIYVKKAIRRPMAHVMRESGKTDEEVEAFIKTGMISEATIREPAMLDLLGRLDADVIRTAKFVNRIDSALALKSPQNLAGRLKVIPPPGGDDQSPWMAGDVVWSPQSRMGDPGIDPSLRQALVADWQTIAGNWRTDAGAVSTAVASLAANLARIEPSLYPPAEKLSLESWYFRMKAFVWNWIIYIIAVVPFLLFVIYRWKTAFRIGVVLLLIAFAIHTASLGIRWHLAGRIPNSNMFEAILASTWFGVLGAIIIESILLAAGQKAIRGLFYLGSAVCAMVAMMCQHFMPTTLTSDIDNVMPVLDDLWLYIHTNVIIWSYALIGMAAITALLYLRYRLGGGDPRVAKAGGAGALILDGAAGKGDSFLKSESTTTTGMVLDAATMVTMELAFIMLWAGLVMGAIWADHSWGRPWGWDPKEVFALCTFVIFLILVHVRIKVRDKGLWTAWLAVVGCGVMLFNWIIINFKISGLHSYA